MSRIVLAVALGLAGTGLLALALDASERDGDVAEATAPTSIYQRRDDCDLPCFSSAASDRFVVPVDAQRIEFVVFANLDDASGPARVSVIDPSGDLRYERLFSSEAPQRATQDTATWTAEVGEWTLTRSYVGVSGSLTFDAWEFDAVG